MEAKMQSGGAGRIITKEQADKEREAEQRKKE